MEEAVVVRRHKGLVDQRSARSVAREHGISRNTVRRYVEGAPIGRRQAVSRGQPVRARVGPRIEALLAESVGWTQGKQRLTARRLWEMLREERHQVGRTLVTAVMAEWKRRRQEVFVPLVYRPGELAEVDFFEVWVDVGGERALTARFVALMGHYALEPCFARPATGHDKGGVEARGKAVRWQHLVPISSGSDLGEINRRLMSRLDRQAGEQRDREGETALDRFEAEREQFIVLTSRAPPHPCPRPEHARTGAGL